MENDIAVHDIYSILQMNECVHPLPDVKILLEFFANIGYAQIET